MTKVATVITGAALVITGGFIATSYAAPIDPEFVTSMTVILIGPNERTTEAQARDLVIIDDVNPLHHLRGMSNATALTTASVSAQLEMQLAAEGLASHVDVWHERRRPLIEVKIRSADRDLGVATADHIADLIAVDVARRQVDVMAETNLISSQTVRVATTGGSAGQIARVRLAILAIAGLAAAVPFALVGQLRSRPARQRVYAGAVR